MSTDLYQSPPPPQVSPGSSPATETVQYCFYDPSLRDRFHLSQLALAGLRHPGLGRIYAQRSYSKGLVSCLEVERERGEADLEGRLRGKLEQGEEWTEGEIGQIVRNVAETMLFLSKQGVICTDLRPANLLHLRNRYILQGLTLPQACDLPEVSIASLSPERREQFLAVQRQSCNCPKAAVYSLAVLCVWLLSPAVWGQIQTPEEVISAVNSVKIGENSKEMLKVMLRRDPEERPDWAQVLSCLSEDCSPLQQLQSCISQEQFGQMTDLLPQLWTSAQVEVAFPCSNCSETAVFPWSGHCPTHVLCEKCGSSSNCPLCPAPKKRLYIVRPKAKAQSTCSVCSRPFQFTASEDWRLNYIGSSTDTKDYCSQACLPAPAVDEARPFAGVTASADWNSAANGSFRDRLSIHVGNWMSFTVDEKRVKAREIREKWGFPMDDSSIIKAIDFIEQGKETRRRENAPFLDLICKTLERYNGSLNCHFCGRFIEGLFEVRWVVCRGQLRGVCSMPCFKAAFSEEVLCTFPNISCPGCGGDLEGRRIAETITFEDVKDFPAKDPSADCCSCYRLGAMRLACGHLRCEVCPEDLPCDFCEEPMYGEDRGLEY